MSRLSQPCAEVNRRSRLSQDENLIRDNIGRLGAELSQKWNVR